MAWLGISQTQTALPHRQIRRVTILQVSLRLHSCHLYIHLPEGHVLQKVPIWLLFCRSAILWSRSVQVVVASKSSPRTIWYDCGNKWRERVLWQKEVLHANKAVIKHILLSARIINRSCNAPQPPAEGRVHWSIGQRCHEARRKP